MPTNGAKMKEEGVILIVDDGVCHSLGCSHYIVKPVEYDKFA